MAEKITPMWRERPTEFNVPRQSKPLIFRDAWWPSGYVCKSTRSMLKAIGYGDTPSEAFADWQKDIFKRYGARMKAVEVSAAGDILATFGPVGLAQRPK